MPAWRGSSPPDCELPTGAIRCGPHAPPGRRRRRGRCHGQSRNPLPTAGGRSCPAASRACPWGRLPWRWRYALQHAGEAVDHLGGRLADRHGAGDVGGAVLILAAGIDQVERARRERQVGFGRALVVRQRAVGTERRNGVEAQILEAAQILAKAEQLLLRRSSRRRRPGASSSTHLRKRDTAAPSRACAALWPATSTGFLTAFGRTAGSRRLRCGLRLLQRLADRRDRTFRVDRDQLARQRLQIGFELMPLVQPNAVAEMSADIVADLLALDEQVGGAVGMDQGEGQRDRRVGDVGAADVERPGDGSSAASTAASAPSLASQSAISWRFSAEPLPAYSSGWTVRRALLGSGRRPRPRRSGCGPPRPVRRPWRRAAPSPA